MIATLIPIEGSADAEAAIRPLIAQSRFEDIGPIHLLHVRPPLTANAARFLSAKTRRDFHRDAAESALRRARELLDAAGLPYTVHVEIGWGADTIARMARLLDARQIVLGAPSAGLIESLRQWLRIWGIRRRAGIPVQAQFSADPDTPRLGAPRPIATA